MDAVGPRPVPSVDQIMSFLATERGLTLLSHWVGVIGTPTSEELFRDQRIRSKIQDEWTNLKALMEGAGFE